jgi:DNA primase
VVLAFDADAAGQGAAEKFYEWEQKYQIEVSVAHFPSGRDPGDLASSDPEALKAAVDGAEPFLGFRLHRILASRHGALTPEQRSRLATEAMKVVNEHPDLNVRKIYAGEVATRTGLPVSDMITIAERRRGEVRAAPVATRRNLGENAEFAVLALLLQRWADVAPWMFEWLFADDLHLRVFRAIAAGNGDVGAALEAADPEAREIIERAAVVDLDVDPVAEVKNLIAAAVRRRLHQRVGVDDPLEILDDRDARVHLERLEGAALDEGVADWLLEWLNRRNEESA